MDLDVALSQLLKNKAIKECFEGSYFNICPINRLHGIRGYPNKRVLNRAHCVSFGIMSAEMIVELNRLAREAIYYNQPWWKIL